MELSQKYWFRTKLATAAVLFSAALLAFAISAGYITPCNTVLAQSTSCNVGDTETFTGLVTFSGGVNGLGVVKTADESVTSSTVLQDDDELVIALEANRRYKLEGVLLVNGTGGNPPGFKFQWSLPASATLDGFVTTAVSSVSAFSEAAAKSYISSGNDDAIPVQGVLITDGTAGNATLQWAQNSSSGSATTVKAGSWIAIQRAD